MTASADPDWTETGVIRWLLTAGRLLPTLQEVLDGLGAMLVNDGAPVWRLRVGMRTVHPLFTAMSAVWERDAGVIDVNEATHGMEQRPAFVGSPMAELAAQGGPLRYRLDASLPRDAHASLRDLKTRGGTDYYGLRLQQSDGSSALLIFVSDRPGGFCDSDLPRLQNIGDALAPLMEIFRLRHLSDAVSAAYLGPRSAARVLDGQITLGDIDRIEAAILFSDLRGWTAMNAALPPKEAVQRVNQYFDLLDVAIGSFGGEILKLMGDGVLAIFPTEQGSGGATACNAAVSAALDALDAAEGGDHGWPMQFGIALHYGEVLYGNVGSLTRLDFTVMGQAVNLAARLEPLCAEFDERIICSQALAGRVDTVARPLGPVRLRGLDEPQAVFAF